MGLVEEYNLNIYVSLVYLLATGSKTALEEIDNSNLESDDKIYLKYLYYQQHDLEEAYSFLLNIAYPYAILKNLYQKARFYLNEMVNSIHRPNKYKKFFDMYKELEEVWEAIKNI